MNKRSGLKAACAVCVLSAATAIPLRAQTLKKLLDFNGSNGSSPFFVGLVQGTDGNLYGTTEVGGLSGQGTIFEVTTGGKLTTLFAFDPVGTAGSDPSAGLVLGADGNLYGVAEYGGPYGSGTVFRIGPAGALEVLHNFDSTDGAAPTGALIQATDGNFYGTTIFGGANNAGTVFKITPSGTLTSLHSFDSADGARPYAALVQGRDGDFYGTTFYGGSSSACPSGCGTVFKITQKGTLTTVHNFDSTDGGYPEAGLLQASDGNFYGTTIEGGANNEGTIFKLTSSGVLTVLHDFSGPDGAGPSASLIQATDGNFYGTAYGGGMNNSGTIFELTSDGTLTTLCYFDSTDGANPFGALLQDTNGAFYGTTVEGGASLVGTVFSLSVGLGPFIETVPTGGEAGTHVTILGTNLTGATSVSFNGTPSTFTVVSSSEITTTVPVGATTGKVQATTPRRTLASNLPFRVRP